MGDTILKMQGIEKWFSGVKALNNVDFEMGSGEVRALIGENGAGKSTLMKILLGIYKADAGSVEFLGENVNFTEPKKALDAGISMIHQEISLIPSMDVAENIWMGREDKFMNMGIINTSKRYEKTQNLLDDLGIKVNPKHKIASLSIAMMQLVELARAVSYDAKLIIMDEPTSALTIEEVELLYTIVRKLVLQNVSVIFISHKIEEIFSICDHVTVLRDGQMIGTRPIDENMNHDDLIQMIVGRDLSKGFVKTPVNIGDVVFEAKNFTSKGVFSDVNFKIRAGEIVGFSGLLGAGRSEIARAIFGIDKHSSGTLYMHGSEIKVNNPNSAIKQGIGMVTEDRLRMGAIYTMSIKHNASIANLFRMVFMGFVKRKLENSTFAELTKKLSLKYARDKDFISSLAGGNQQKVILARWLLTNPKLLILDEPTRGIDVGAKMEIYKLINNLAAQGLAIMFISSEMPEILSLCDRTFVVREGKLVHECARKDTTQEVLAMHAFGLGSTKQ